MHIAPDLVGACHDAGAHQPLNIHWKNHHQVIYKEETHEMQ